MSACTFFASNEPLVYVDNSKDKFLSPKKIKQRDLKDII